MILSAELEVRRGLEAAARALRADDLPVPAVQGKLLRPRVAFAALPPGACGDLGESFWCGALAIQMVHEASLLHDDILDGAATRRGRPTSAASDGIGAALVRGDHLLTASYRAAARADRPAFLACFIRAVERTVAGEIRQGRAAGSPVDSAAYREAIEGKSGELFGAALGLAAAWTDGDVEAAAARGRRLGAIYQLVDDLLDYCPSAALGKPPFQDLRQRKWTLVLEEAGLDGFPEVARESAPTSEVESWVHGRLFGAGGSGETGDTPMRRSLARVEREARVLSDGMESAGLAALLEEWLVMARRAVAAEEAASGRATGSRDRLRASPPGLVASGAPGAAEASVEARVVEKALEVGDARRWGAYLARHGRTFRFASRLFPARHRRQVEAVYAWCRFTDDLVDEALVPADQARARLGVWRELSRAAFEGRLTGVPLADDVMGAMRRGEVPFRYADELLSGVAMDLEPRRYGTPSELALYTFRVASVVGGWMTELFGVHEPRVLERAFDLGHAMQLTNIVRDVGEDWRRGRLYVPLSLLERHGVALPVVDLLARRGGPVPRAWIEVTEELMGRADLHYDRAFEALPELPPWYARPVAVAARAYQGIHDAVRANGWDNGSLRAHTGLAGKVRLGAGALMELRRARRRWRPAEEAPRGWARTALEPLP